MGFDELGQHGMIVGQIEEYKKRKIEFVPLDEQEFVEQNLKIDEIESKEELIEKINQIKLEENKFYKIKLEGTRNFTINPYEIEKYIDKKIIKIKDETKIKINLIELANKNNLKGIFVKNMLQKIQHASEGEKQKLIRAIEIGLEAM